MIDLRLVINITARTAKTVYKRLMAETFGCKDFQVLLWV